MWKEKKEKSKKTIESIAALLKTGQELGIEMDDSLIRKIKKLKEETENRKLQVALIGGFSEGKTSIAAAWLGEMRTDMKIAPEESSDAVNVYDVDAKIQIADTPGLFGYKGTLSGEKYKEITRKHISEADIILYVMNPNNPIKESYKEYLLWMFRELNVLPRTIFVLSRFDREVDIEDEDAYAKRLKIKSDNIKQRLKELIDLKQEESNDISIIAVSANPFDKGIEYWLKNEKQYQKLSHIPQLQSAASEIISKNGVFEIMQERGKSIMRDIIAQTLPIAKEKFLKIHEGCSKMRDTCKDIGNELSSLDGKISQVRPELRNKIVGYFSDLILQVKGSSLETYEGFFQREIGSEGIIVDNKINGFFDESVGSLNPSMTKLTETYAQETNHLREYCEAFGIKDLLKFGGSWISAGNITNKTVLATRDFLNLSIKFKPWGAIKLAGDISKIGGAILSGLGILIDGYEMWDNHKKAKAFEEAKNKMVEGFEGQRKELLDLINGEDFINKFFGGFLILKKEIEKMNDSLAQEEERREKFEYWKNECVIVEAEIVKN
jgi:GTP-binding protein EngB required for normal cell division